MINGRKFSSIILGKNTDEADNTDIHGQMEVIIQSAREHFIVPFWEMYNQIFLDEINVKFSFKEYFTLKVWVLIRILNSNKEVS